MPQEGWTKAELAAEATRRGFNVRERLITDWCQLGLLDHPEHQGAGRGQGSRRGLFPPNQHRLFLELLQKRQGEKPTRPYLLAQIPLYLWVYWGDEYVPLRQARKALLTWIEGAMGRGLDTDRAAARALVEQISSPKAPRKEQRELIEAIANIGYRGKVDDPQQLQFLFDVVIDPGGTGRAYGPPGLPLEARAIAVTQMRLMAAVATIRADAADQRVVTDELLCCARAELCTSLREWVYKQPALLEQVSAADAQRLRLEVSDQQLFEGVGKNLLLVIAGLLQLVPLPETPS